MANAYVAPNFNIDTSTNVAGLTALKGSAPASTDYINIYNTATVTIESDLTIAGFYEGNNAARNYAGAKNAAVVWNSGVLTLGTNTAHEGLSGPGNTYVLGSWTFNGTAASPLSLVCTNALKVSNNNTANCKITATYVNVTNNLLIVGGAAHAISNCNFLMNVAGTNYGMYFDNSRKTLPEIFDNNTFTGYYIGWYDGTSTSPMTYGNFWQRFPNNKFVRTANGGSIVYLNPTTAGVYLTALFGPTVKRFWNILGRGR